MAKADMSPLHIQRNIQIANLAELCTSIEKVLSVQGDKGDIFCVWGEFKVYRELIRQGVRFTLPGCPNALQWTITAMNESKCHVRIHCTIEQPDHDADFIDSLQQFVEDWKSGLESGEAGMKSGGGAATTGNCLPVYG